MMRFAAAEIALSFVAVASFPRAGVQAAGPPPKPEVGNTVLIAQYHCNPADHARVDQLLKEVTASVLNRMASEGKINS